MRARLLVSVLCLLPAPAASAESPAADNFASGGLVVLFAEGLLVPFSPANGQAGSAVPASAGTSSGLVFGPHGNAFVVSSDAEQLLVFNPKGAPGDTFPLGKGVQPSGIAFGPDGLLWVLDAGADRILHFTVEGTPQGELPLPAGDYAGCTLAFGPDGHLFVTQRGGGVLELSAGAELLHVLGDDALADPTGLAVSPEGRLIVANGADIVVLDEDGEEVDRFGAAQIGSAVAVALGPDGHVYVADAALPALLEYDADGTHLDTFGQQVLVSGDPVEPTPVALAFVPWRYAAKIKGDIALPGAPLAKVKELDAVLSLLPGSGTVMIALTDDVTQDDDLASVFGTSLVVLHGFEIAPPAPGAARLWQAAQVDDPALTAGFATLSLRVTGDMKNQQFVPKQAKGTLHRAGTAGVYAATVKTGKSLD